MTKQKNGNGGIKRETLAELLRRRMQEVRLNTYGIEKESEKRGNKISQSYVSQILNGQVGSLTVRKIEALAAVIEVEPVEVFEAARRAA
jgi:transcriptional regulator with XRE-family HTH domain